MLYSHLSAEKRWLTFFHFSVATTSLFCEESDEVQLERVRFAALKLSKGDLRELKKAVKLAQTDWRDLLMAAGFGNDVNAHKKWSQDEL